MAYHTTDADGITLLNPSTAQMRELLDELEEGVAHPDVSLTHDSGWSISVYPSGILTLENLDARGKPVVMKDVPRLRALELWVMLSRGETEAIRSLDWKKS